jgi:hypothetical protein
MTNTIELTAKQIDETGLSFEGLYVINQGIYDGPITTVLDDVIYLDNIYAGNIPGNTVTVGRDNLARHIIGQLLKILPSFNLVSCDYTNESEWCILFGEKSCDGLKIVLAFYPPEKSHFNILAQALSGRTAKIGDTIEFSEGRGG